MKTIYAKWILPAVAAVLGGAMMSCEDQPDKFELTSGTPEVKYVRTTTAPDSLITEAYVDNLICLVGNNLTSIRELYFNDQPAILNTSYITTTLFLSTFPAASPPRRQTRYT